MSDKPPAPSSESLQSSSSPPQLDPASERLLGDIARGIEGNTQGLFALKAIFTKIIADALKEMRGDRLDADERYIKRLGELNATISRIDLGNEKTLGAVQELIDQFASDSAQERGLLAGAREGVDKAVVGIERVRDITERNIKILAVPESPNEVDIEVKGSGAAPLSVRVFVSKMSVHAVNLLWPITVRVAATLPGKIFQAVGGGAVLAALARILHFYVTHQ